MESIVSNEKICYVCGTPFNLHKHHIFYGSPSRKQSEKYGCWVYLCADHHNMSNSGIHFDHAFDICMKRLCQALLESQGMDRDEFRKVFGKSWL